MKKSHVLLPIAVISCIFLTGCNKKEIVTEPYINTGISNPGFFGSQKIEKRNISIQSGVMISGERYLIYNLGSKLIYSGFFSIVIPKGVFTGSYENTDKEEISFSDKESGRFLSITAQDISGQNIIQITDREYCLPNGNEENLISKKLITQEDPIQKTYITKFVFSGTNQKIPITNQIPANIEMHGTRPTSGSYNERRKSEICFVHTNKIYKIAIGNYDKEYLESILRTLKFSK